MSLNDRHHGAQRLRLDALIAERGLADSRSRARDAILRGHVSVDGAVVSRPSLTVPLDAEITIDDPAGGYVSRAALKLIAGLDAFGFDVSGKLCLDVGASTGGFTQVLLERGAARVVAIDVGHDQMHTAVRDDPRVHAVDGLNARDMTLADIGGEAPLLVVADISFISLTLALPPALSFAAAGAEAVLLVKPQFEAGREAIGRGGLLRGGADAAAVIAAERRQWLDSQPGWRSIGLIPSPILGGDGNAEFVLGGRKNR
ncbi:TlyA family RNA methyltransferase [Mangrovicella endophytica]|uniref:TlyA family RNA methyltransferase n=1 Tax=Mangrovicella endophytica TaxID=2066697 RepID=UPI000C9E08CD|nr:TlyA family RNA methyltransferase [Mangrovicella endophytica]